MMMVDEAQGAGGRGAQSTGSDTKYLSAVQTKHLSLMKHNVLQLILRCFLGIISSLKFVRIIVLLFYHLV